MRTNISIIILLFFIIPFCIARPEPVGIVSLNSDYLLAWNQGRIVNETYFNRTTGLIQIANRLNRTGDIKYEYGYARKVGTTYTFINLEDPLGNEEYRTDFSSYYYASSFKNISGGGNWVYLARNNSQGLNDDYVKVTYVLQSKNAILGNFYFASRLSRIDIGQDGVNEMSVVTLINGSEEVVWNETTTKTFNNITRIQINGLEYSFDLQFPGGVIAVYNRSSSWVNGDWTFLKPIGTIPAMTKFTTTHYWIDAICTISCIPGCPLSTAITPISNRYINRSKEVTIGCQWYTLGFGCSGSPCSFSGCYLQLTHNVSKSTFRDLARFEDYTTNVNLSQTTLCANSTSCFVDANTIPQNSFIRWGVLGGNLPGILRQDTVRCNIDFVLGNTSRYSSGTISVFVNYTIVKNITAWTPTNNKFINYSATPITFGCNWTETQPLNISLFIDDVYYGNATVTGFPFWTLRNLSKTVSINRTGIYTWGCKACYAGGECIWSNTLWGIGGNFTFTLYRNPSLTLVVPLNGSIFIGFQNVTFNVSWQNETPDNITLYIDEQPNLTVTAGINLTTSRYFDYYAWHFWTARACYRDYCLYSQNGTLEFTIQAPGILEGIASLFKRIDEMDREEEINSVWVLGSIALVGLIITEILRRRRELASLAGKPPVI